MNQILMVNDSNDNGKKELKKVIKFFAIIIVIFAVIFGGQAIYSFATNRINQTSYAKPTLSVEKNGSNVNITASGEIAINKLEYTWDKGTYTELKCDGKKKVSHEIQIPMGEHDLYVVITDVEGNKTKFEPTKIVFAEGEDVTKPTISIVAQNPKIVITATDNKEMDYIAYQWDNEQDVKVTKKSEDKKSISTEIPVEKGTKVLTVTAVDKTGNKDTITKKIVGSDGPTVKVTLSDGNFVVKVSADNGVTKVLYTLNDEEHQVEGIPEGAKEYEFKVPLQEGVDNFLKINAYENELMTEYKCKKTNR